MTFSAFLAPHSSLKTEVIDLWRLRMVNVNGKKSLAMYNAPVVFFLVTKKINQNYIYKFIMNRKHASIFLQLILLLYQFFFSFFFLLFLLFCLRLNQLNYQTKWGKEFEQFQSVFDWHMIKYTICCTRRNYY